MSETQRGATAEINNVDEKEERNTKTGLLGRFKKEAEEEEEHRY